ncbi:hypothetical protein BGZ75_007969 [Mortierella antarctica]|nr:hypothetical protein BGZ75_007969 [Mortierella antarctica]
MKEQLHMAGRFGLELQQNLEHAQRAERQSFAQLQALQDENSALQSRVHQQTLHFNTHLDGSEDEMKNLTSENESLQKELDGCRRELKMFRKELDGLVEQMNEMGTEVLDAKTKVTVYSRRLNEVEQELTATQGLNVDLQEQLRVTLERQKQTHSSTAMAMKSMQSELGKVLSDSGTIRSTLEELENRQDKCEGKVVEMMSNTKEYAHLLEEAQTTIQTMRIESDMEGRAWLPLASPSGRIRSTGQLSTLAMENPDLDNALDFPQGPNKANEDAPQEMSLGKELGLGVSFNQPKEGALSSPPPTPATATMSAPFSSPEPLTPATSPQVPMASQNKQQLQPRPTQSPEPIQQEQLPTPAPNESGSKFSTPAPPLISTELQQRLEEHNILQTVLNSSLPSSRPQWNPSVSLEHVPPPSHPSQGRSRSSSRAATNASMSSSRCSSRSVSQMSLHHHPSSSSTSPGSSVRVSQGQNQRQQSSSVLASLQTSSSPRSKSSPGSTSSLMDAIAVHTGKRSQNSAMSVNNDSRKGGAVSQNRPGRSTTAMTVEKTPNPNAGLKYLLKGSGSSGSGSNSSNGSPAAVSNVMTKAKGTANNNTNNNNNSPSSKAASPVPMRGSRTP